MQQIISIAGLRSKIQLLKIEQADKELQLKEQFNRTLESLKPVNLVRSTFNNVVTSPYFIDNIVGIGIGLATGYLSKRIITGTSRIIIRRLFGAILQFGVTRLVSQRNETIASSRQPVFKNIFRKKELNSK
jgi:hypothetical protein